MCINQSPSRLQVHWLCEIFPLCISLHFSLLFIFIFPHDCQFCRETEMLWIQRVFRAKHLLAPAVLRPQVTGFLTVRRKEDEDALNKN